MEKMYVVRKRNGILNLFIGGHAIKLPNTWGFTDGAIVVRLDKEDFPNVKWEDDEPTEVLLVQKKNKFKEYSSNQDRYEQD